ncbi:MAG: ATP phosphoribosyltransferase regulatory subunit, partial [Burkholderiales bacterium]|nr:ATP phosphoribosyltransferase regulatory subunit [Burkholderiales bacterium]
AGVESDIEIQSLMISALHHSGIEHARVDLGHVGVFRALMRRFGIDGEHESELFQALQSKDVPTLRELVATLDAELAEALLLLPQLYGGAEVLTRARRRLPHCPEIETALGQLEAIAAALSQAGQMVDCFDLAELRGYHYHSGVVFAAYARGRPNAIALGGRYDEVGKAFGRARPATGFTMDLRALAALASAKPDGERVLAPYAPADQALRQTIAGLRATGTVVIVDLPGHENTREELGCARQLVLQDGRWQVVDMIEDRKAG